MYLSNTQNQRKENQDQNQNQILWLKDSYDK